MTLPLDPAHDPDRFDPNRTRAVGPVDPVGPVAPLDWALDPDRYDPQLDVPPREAGDAPAAARQPLLLGRTGGTRQTLPDLLAEGSFDDPPSPYIWIIGLAGTVAFLLLVAFIFSHLSP